MYKSIDAKNLKGSIVLLMSDNDCICAKFPCEMFVIDVSTIIKAITVNNIGITKTNHSGISPNISPDLIAMIDAKIIVETVTPHDEPPFVYNIVLIINIMVIINNVTSDTIKFNMFTDSPLPSPLKKSFNLLKSNVPFVFNRLTIMLNDANTVKTNKIIMKIDSNDFTNNM